MKTPFKTALRPTTLLAGAFLAGGLLPSTSVRAADPYDKSLEARVQALEKELNLMENDSKGKNVQTEGAVVPTFIRAAKNVQELTFSGELRLRDEYSTVDGQAVQAEAQANRLRFRFRLFADYKLDDSFFAGAAVQTAVNADSGNTTFSEGFDNYQLYLWRFFVGWHSKDDNLKFIAGKQANPFYQETELLWDADISPTGVTEQVKFSLSPQFELGLIAGQFIFYDNNENAFYNNPRTITNAAGAQVANPAYVPGGDNNVDAYLAYQQLFGTFKASKDLTITAAGGYLFYPGHGGTNAAGATIGAGSGVGAQGGTLANSVAFNSANATRNLSLGTFDGDVKVGLGAIKLKVYGQAVYNFQGGARAAEEYNQPTHDGTADKVAFAAGFTVGSDYTIKKKGDYLLLAEYRQVGLGSVDPNLNDSDFNSSRLGFRGVKVAGSYGFYPWLIASVTYFGSNNLGSDRNLNIGVGNTNASHIIQFDLTTKF